MASQADQNEADTSTSQNDWPGTAAGMVEAGDEYCYERTPFKPERQHCELYVDNPIIHEYRDEFRHPLLIQTPNPYDVVYSFTNQVLKQYNRQSFSHRKDPLLIEALSIGPTVFYGCDTSSAVHLLVRHRLFIKVQLKVMCDLDRGWGAGTVMLLDDDRWIPLKQWLKTLGEPSLGKTPRGWYKMQYLWWKTKDQPFRFLDLPLEIQKKIMLYALGEHVAPYETSEKDRRVTVITQGAEAQYLHQDAECRDTDCTPPLVPRTNKSMLCLKKELSAMARSILHEDTIKLYGAPRFLHHIPQKPEFLRRIELAFTHGEYIKLFKVHIPGLPLASAPAGAAYLRSLPLLRELRIFFRAPVSRTASPWMPSHYIENDGTTTSREHYPCQKTLVDCIMAFATEHVKHIGTVRLTGYVKTETKNKWEAILKKKSSNICTTYVEEEKQRIRGLHISEVPPECLCPARCGYVAIDNLDYRARERCGHGPGDSCWCWRNAPKPRDYKEAYQKYRFDFDDEGLGKDQNGYSMIPWVPRGPSRG